MLSQFKSVKSLLIKYGRGRTIKVPHKKPYIKGRCVLKNLLALLLVFVIFTFVFAQLAHGENTEPKVLDLVSDQQVKTWLDRYCDSSDIPPIYEWDDDETTSVEQKMKKIDWVGSSCKLSQNYAKKCLSDYDCPGPPIPKTAINHLPGGKP